MKVTWKLADGREITADVRDGLNMMEAAVANNVPRVIGECGGSLSCATCHVYVEGGWFERLPPMSELEQEMLALAHDPKPNSRLGCQIKIDDALEGLIVRTPVRQ